MGVVKSKYARAVLSSTITENIILQGNFLHSVLLVRIKKVRCNASQLNSLVVSFEQF